MRALKAELRARVHVYAEVYMNIMHGKHVHINATSIISIQYYPGRNVPLARPLLERSNRAIRVLYIFLRSPTPTPREGNVRYTRGEEILP